MPRIIFNFVILLLWQITLLPLVYAQEEILEAIVKDGENEIHLKWKKTNQLLANKNLPVWITKVSLRGPLINYDMQSTLVKENIGEFIMYQDVEKSSAVVYFKNLNVLHGTIDTRYSIDGLPLTELNQVHLVNGPYVKGLKKNEYRTDHTKPLDLSIRHDEIDCAPSTSSQNEPPNKRPRTYCNIAENQLRTLYPEILVFVTNDEAKSVKAKEPNNYLATIVKNYIIYFNAIDMLFAKLLTHGVVININIAGIVIDIANVLPMVKSKCRRALCALRDDICLDTPVTMDLMMNHIMSNANLFVEDSFDIFFVSTGAILQRDDEELRGSSLSANIYNARVSRRTYSGLLGAITQIGKPDSYVVATHEISHVLDVTHDPPNEGFYNRYMQCYSIMTQKGKFCQDCLKWSDKNIANFKEFATNNRNRCFLLNTPRSLHPYGSPIRSLTPSDQCLCYGFEPRRKTHLLGLRDMIAASNCNRNLICKKKDTNNITPYPLDGTPCDTEKVCWNRRCRQIPNAA